MKLMRAAAYGRYSSDNQREESITAQLRAIEEHCKKKGYVLVKTYTDEAKSATTDNRASFQQMISDSELNIFDVVLVHKLDRFARNRYDSAFYRRKLKLNKVSVESILEQLDNSPESIILESVLEGMAEYYSKNLAREVRKGLRENADKAMHNGGRPPYGLKINPTTHQYEIDETRYKAVQIYFDGVAAGITMAEIARRINAAGFRTYTGSEFKITSFDTWGYNRKYKGDYIWDASAKKDDEGKRNGHKRKPIDEQTIIPGAIPAIITTELWEKVNAMILKRASNSEKAKLRAKHVYLLSGKVFCGNPECGKSFAGESYTSRGKPYAYYKCSGKCGNKSVDKTAFEKLVIQQLDSFCFTDEAMKSIALRVSELYRERRSNVDEEIEPIKKEIQSLEGKLNNWIDAIGDGLLDKNVLAGRIKEANEKKVFLESQLLQAQIIKTNSGIDENAIISVLEKQKHLLFSTSLEERKQVVQEFVDSVYVLHKDDGEIDIELNVRVTNGGGEALLLATLTFTMN
ncbi:recombinase family protein [Desulfosporosinus sp.]|uniref:recombinase family protein n=1 Tax=Desulfosporosinus sp. TaxID=157907 RepID=UPI002328600E|nr:recombinase family protein [Desulfosporosinus sp.]MDA8224205.1 recombinase family protein [Desulfitobacterium hafniense]